MSQPRSDQNPRFGVFFPAPDCRPLRDMDGIAMIRKQLFFIALCFFCASAVFGQNRAPAFEMNERLGRGINMGNTFEAPSEAEWGNPWKPEYFEIIADLGFDHVRLPVRWEPVSRSMDTPPYTINSEFLERIKEVVDKAIAEELHIIVNMHHHDALFDDPEGQKERFISQCSQIADYFKDYPDLLLFEVLNEPHGNLTPQLWNEFFSDALTEIRKTNPTRVVIMGVAEFGGLGGLSKLELPDDEYIIVSPHYYNPFNFTHQGAEWVGPQADERLGTEWLDTEADRETVETEFSYALQFSENNRVPIHVGEFGAYSTADIASRERWTTFLARWFEEQGLSWAYWEFSAGFGIYDPAKKQLVSPLVNALLHNEMPEPTPIFAVPVYQSNFTSGSDGWTLSTQGGASGSASTSDGLLNVALTSPGTEGWHIQLVKGGINLEKDKLYRVSFKAQAAADRSATFYLGKASDPWNAYSGYSGLTIGTALSTYSYTFTMTSPTDPAARIVFDLGTSATGMSITDVKVDELRFVVTEAEESLAQMAYAYPNPVTNRLYSEVLSRFNKATVFDSKGSALAEFSVTPSTQYLDLSGVPEGYYIIRLSGSTGQTHMRIIKR